MSLAFVLSPFLGAYWHQVMVELYVAGSVFHPARNALL